ncbi:RluA family pseudouridine synthase [Formicincola oecophyllae]|uniref:RluA family pseudouridine synthase n=1 Tax=Formicincola oecophyllae TaxID=2558361 RepID=A0A4Y6U7G4_9PROT|nr:RluA family pseudouridine synthase [Formicincola oecophyllae]QDH13252.1 RluA family pseudouridine synthase [Formicincola oecophyllae]
MTTEQRPAPALGPSLFKPGQALPILVEDRQFAIINKPPGLAAHPGRTTSDSVEERLSPQKRGGPWLAHRLDSDTSGCLLIAKRKTALLAAQQAFARTTVHSSGSQVSKTYWAVTDGIPEGPEGVLNHAIKRVALGRHWWMAPCQPHDEGALEARTSWRLMGYDHSSHTALLQLELHTGRTHQARLACLTLGCPIKGDGVYGIQGVLGTWEKGQARAQPTLQGGMMLHARSLELTLPSLEKSLLAVAPLPPAMARHVQAMAPVPGTGT